MRGDYARYSFDHIQNCAWFGRAKWVGVPVIYGPHRVNRYWKGCSSSPYHLVSPIENDDQIIIDGGALATSIDLPDHGPPQKSLPSI